MKINAVNNISSKSLKKETKELNSTNKTANYKQITDISNICYKPISFGRSVAEHKSWGAQIDPETKEASFKILTYPDTKKVTVTVKKRGTKKELTYELENKGNGVFETGKKIAVRESR